MKYQTFRPVFAYSGCWWALVGLVRWGEQCRTEAWQTEEQLPCPKVYWAGGIATNEKVYAFGRHDEPRHSARNFHRLTHIRCYQQCGKL